LFASFPHNSGSGSDGQGLRSHIGGGDGQKDPYAERGREPAWNLTECCLLAALGREDHRRTTPKSLVYLEGSHRQETGGKKTCSALGQCHRDAGGVKYDYVAASTAYAIGSGNPPQAIASHDPGNGTPGPVTSGSNLSSPSFLPGRSGPHARRGEVSGSLIDGLEACHNPRLDLPARDRLRQAPSGSAPTRRNNSSTN
jgi:hypothetical protein